MATQKDRICVSIRELCDLTGLGQSTAKAILARGEIRSFLASPRRRVVPLIEIEAWMDRRLAATEAGHEE